MSEQSVLIPSVLLESLATAGLTISDLPRSGRIELLADGRRDRWWVRIDVFVRDDNRRPVASLDHDVITETLVVPFVGELEEI